MALRFYMDVHVPRAITNGLASRGIDVLTAQTDGASQFEDNRLLDRALELDRLLFTRDDDLLREAAARQKHAQRFASVVYAHQHRVTIGQCIADLEFIAKVGTDADKTGQVFHLPLT